MKQDYDRVKHIVIIINASMGILYGIVHGIRAFSEGYTVLGMVDIFVSAFFILILIYTIKKPESKFQYYSTVSLMSVFFLYLFITGGVAGTGYLWSVIIPLTSVFMLGWRPGALFSLGFFIAMTASVCLDFWGFAVLDLPDQETLSRLFSVYIIAGIVAVAYELGKNRTENELKRAKLKAEKASHAKSEFLAVMSHEIRTPLSGVLGATELLLSTEMNRKQKDYAEIANVSGKSLLSILDDILDFSKIEAGSLKLDISPTPIRELLERSVDIISFQAKVKDIELHLSIPDDIPAFIWTDSTRIRQILINLLTNAVKFTDSGRIELKVLFRKLSENKGEFTFSVSDTGIGISDEQQQKLFKPFSQADTSITRKFGGTGLGLMISKLLVKKMGGSIGLKSEEGKGSEFFFTIEAEYSDSDGSGYADMKPHEKNIISSQNVKILIVEDIAVNTILLKSMIAQFLPEAVFYEAVSGQEALKTLETVSPDLILMDIQMPDMDGIEATKIIRQNEVSEQKQYTPVIAITAGAVMERKEIAIEAGMDEFITKPLTAKKLASVLKRYVH